MYAAVIEYSEGVQGPSVYLPSLHACRITTTTCETVHIPLSAKMFNFRPLSNLNDNIHYVDGTIVGPTSTLWDLWGFV